MKKLNSLYYGILNTILNSVFPLLTLPYILQTLGPELYGKNLHAALFHQLFSFLFILAVNPYALRLFSNVMGDECEAEKVYHRIVSFQFVMSSIATFVQLLVITILGLLSPLYILYTVVTFFSFMNVEWLFQAKQDYKVIFLRTFFVRSVILCALFLCVKNESDFYLYNFIMAFNFLLPSIVSFLIARKYYVFEACFFNVKMDFLGAKYFYINGAIGSVYAHLDQVVIGLLVTSKELAILNLIKTLTATIMSIPNMVNRFIMPDAFKAFTRGELRTHHKKYLTIMLLCLLFGLSVFCIFGLPVVSLFLGEKVDFKQLYIILISISVFFTSIAVFIDTQSSIILGLEKITTISNFIVAIISPLAAIILFNEFKYLSPFIGFIIGEFVGVLIMIIIHMFIFKTKFVNNNSGNL